MKILFLVALALSCLAFSSAVIDDGMIRPFCSNVRTKYNRANVYSRNIRLRDNLWQDGKVTYEFANYFTQDERDLVRNALSEIENRTCIRWMERQNGETPYVRISADYPGCFADLGISKGRDAYRLNLQRDNGQTTCWWKSIIQHEALHVLGVDHEQNRPDRDDHIEVKWGNIGRNKIYNFFKDRTEDSSLPYCDNTMSTFDHCTSGYVTTTQGFPYDYSSIMHYQGDAFSFNGQPTMVAKDSNESLERTFIITDLDFKKLNAAYCDWKPETTEPPKKDCEDVMDHCEYYPYLCTDYPEWAKQYCQNSCNMCD